MKQINLKEFIRDDISKMEPYAPVLSLWDLNKKFNRSNKKILKLDQGENQYGVLPKVRKAIRQANIFNYYPDPEYKNLRAAIAKYVETKTDYIMVGAGADELLDLILRLVINDGDQVINCPPTFGMYQVLVELNKGIVITVPREKDYSLNIKEILKKVNKKTKAIFICSPNNPTGNIATQEEIVTLLKKGKLIIVDEAYFEFCGKTVISLVTKYKNLIVLRTFSKWAGLAGLRLGYAVMDPFLVKEMLKIKMPFNVNLAAEVCGIAALDDLTSAKKIIKRIIEERERIYKQLTKIDYLTVYPSEANFLPIRAQNLPKLKEYLESKLIIARYYFSDGLMRLSIGTPEQNSKVIKIFKEFKFEKIRKYAFLDRDGTLIFEPQDTFQIDSIEKLKVLDGVIKGLVQLKKMGYELIMVTNQDGLGTSTFPRANFETPQNKMLSIFEENGIKFKKIFICPHLLSQNCDCRKPKKGLVKKFLKNNEIDINKSFVCGDRTTDKLFAENIGIKFISVQTNGNFLNALVKGGVIL